MQVIVEIIRLKLLHYCLKVFELTLERILFLFWVQRKVRVDWIEFGLLEKRGLVIFFFFFNLFQFGFHKIIHVFEEVLHLLESFQSILSFGIFFFSPARVRLLLIITVDTVPSTACPRRWGLSRFRVIKTSWILFRPSLKIIPPLVLGQSLIMFPDGIFPTALHLLNLAVCWPHLEQNIPQDPQLCWSVRQVLC